MFIAGKPRKGTDSSANHVVCHTVTFSKLAFTSGIFAKKRDLSGKEIIWHASYFTFCSAICKGE